MNENELTVRFVPKPLTNEEWNELQTDWRLVCSSEKRKGFTITDAKFDHSWSHYVVGGLMESIKQGVKYEN